MEKVKLFIILAVSMLTVGGCAPKTITSVEEAKQYAHEDLPSFIKERFYRKETVVESALDGVISILSKVSTNHPAQKKEPSRLKPDGTVIYQAPFTKMNTEQVTRPLIDLLSFCEARGGKLREISPFNKNLASESVGASIMANALYGKEKINSLSRKYGISPDAYQQANKSFISNMLQDYENSGSFEGVAILNRHKSYFGVFTCTNQYDVAIIPIKYTTPRQHCLDSGSRPGDLLCSVHTLDIAIKPIQKSGKIQ